MLDGGEKQEDEMFCTFPELFVTMVSTESLENNEALSAYGLQPIVCREDCKMLLKEHLWVSECCYPKIALVFLTRTSTKKSNFVFEG